MAYHPAPSRRAVLGGAGALFSWNFMPRFAQAAGGRDPRFVVIILRGALDGLTAVPPIGDPSYKELRQSIALTLDGPHPALKLDGFFALDPSMPNLAQLYHANQAAIVHACATAYRDRSHFDGQDVLESGYPGPGHTETGWLNRLLLTLPMGEKVAPGAASTARGLAVGANAPLVIRGKAPVLGWAPATPKPADAELPQRLMELYAHTDPLFSRLLTEGIATGKIASGMDVKDPGRRRRSERHGAAGHGCGPPAGAARWTARRGTGLRRLGHARPGARASVPITGGAGQLFCSIRARAGAGLEGYRDHGRHGVWPDRSRQWHARD